MNTSTGRGLEFGDSHVSSRSLASRTASLSFDALLVNPALAEKLRSEKGDFVSHGARSISRLNLPEGMEKADLRRPIEQTLKLEE